jgi:hypothetical protein
MSRLEGALMVDAEGPLLGSVQDAVDLVAQSMSSGKPVIVIPKERMDPAFFELRTRVAGEFLQKMVNYRRIVAVIGDFSPEMERSTAFRDFVLESNRGKEFFFLPDLDAVAERLAR